MTDQSKEFMKKRLLWRATHRGIKEMDLIAGGFAAVRLPYMSQLELEEFEILLELPDQDLLAWVTLQEAIPETLASPLLLDLIAFRPDLGK